MTGPEGALVPSSLGRGGSMHASNFPVICLLEDDPIMGESLSQFFELESLPCDWFTTIAGARGALSTGHYSVMISDIRLPDGHGGEFYREMVELGANLPPTIFITGYGTIPQAVELLQSGARDYITKPFDPDELLGKLRRICPDMFLAGSTAIPGKGAPVLGVSPVMRRLETLLDRVAPYRVPVLITGESGVGKELAARYLHSRREEGASLPFVAVNCAAVPAELIEAELFGAEKGAYTGAHGQRIGLFEQAGLGTLFLDEAGDMPLAMQAKLLRVVQEQCVRRVGGSRDIAVAPFQVWATNSDLPARISAGEFREDLFFRIGAVHMRIPPLREHVQDIPWLVGRFLDEFARETGRSYRMTPAAERFLVSRPWPGNVRELRQTIQRAAIFNESSVLTPDSFLMRDRLAGIVDTPQTGLKEHLSKCERWYIQQCLEQSNFRIAQTAKMLGISRKNLWERMNRLGLERTGRECSQVESAGG
ncbi:MAG: sigma-54 dependent transcriptional regulator [Magnetococcus sp. WYHC-3]